MKIRGARPRFDVDVRASAAPVLGVIERILDLELLNRIGSGDGDPRSTERSDLGDIGAVTVRIYSVQHEIVVAASCSIGSDLLASGPQLGCVHDIGVGPSGQAENLGVIAIDQWQVDNGLVIDHSSESGILRLQEWGLGAHRDLLLYAVDRQLNLQPAHLGDLNLNTFQDEWSKSKRADG